MNPVVAAIVIVVLVAIVGFYVWSHAGGKTFTKDEVRGGTGTTMPLKMGK